jgi:hypothetical protein
MLDYALLREKVARAICESVGRDPDVPFRGRHGRPSEDVKEWERWGAEATAAIRAIHAFLSEGDFWWRECQECGVGSQIETALPHISKPEDAQSRD